MKEMCLFASMGKFVRKKAVALVMTCGSIIQMVWCNDTDERNFIDKEKKFHQRGKKCGFEESYGKFGAHVTKAKH